MKIKNDRFDFSKLGNLVFLKESDFAEWFKHNYFLFGLKSIIINRMFPDVIAETYFDTTINIELELCANSFKYHGHDPNSCDLIISFVKSFRMDNVKGVPVLSIFNGSGFTGGSSYDLASLELTDYFKNMVIFFERSLSAFISKESALQDFYDLS